MATEIAPHRIQITYDPDTGDLDVGPDSKRCSLGQGDRVQWSCAPKDLPWKVIFGQGAPVTPNVGGPGNDTLRITSGRNGDFGRCKYTVAVWIGSEVRILDPELIVDP